MVAIPEIGDPTLEAADRALEAAARRATPRPYLGMSAIGNPCDRALWYGFRWAADPDFDAATLKRFEDGHMGEDLQIKRLRMVDGVTLLNIDPESGQQFGFSDFNDHFKGHMDGVALGLLQAPKTWHVYEHKVCNEKKFAKLEKIKASVGEKNALRQWDKRYYAQAVLYMAYAELDRHYMTVSSPGGRATTSVRTEADPAEAAVLIARAKRIIETDRAPPRISDDPSWYECRYCEHHAICHQGNLPRVSCRTCLYSSPAAGGSWHCSRWARELSRDAQRDACPAHLYLPSLIAGEQTDAADDGSWVEYRLRSGEVWRDGVKS